MRALDDSLSSRWLLIAWLPLVVAACGSGANSTGTTGASSTGGSSTGTGGSSTGTGGGGTGGAAVSSASGTGGMGAGGTSSGGSGGNGAGGGGPIVCDEPGGAVPPLELTQVATGLDLPVFVTSEPADASRLYVVEQGGLIKLVKNGVLSAQPFLDATAIINDPDYAQDEKGLLGLAFHPNYGSNGRFFIYYNAAQGSALTLAEMTAMPGNPDLAQSQPVKVFFSVSQGVQTNHNGGMLAFGDDGFLYVGVGDGGGSGDPNNHGQNIDVKLGKILRVDVDNYPAAPAGNLQGGDPDIWDYGLRNPWRFSFDRCGGDLYIGDVGQSSREEIDVQPAGQGPRNYGWSVLEGTYCYKPNQQPGCNAATLYPPVKEYDHNSGGCSVTGGYVYRGNAIPALRGAYLYADYCTREIRTLRWKAGTLSGESNLTADLQSTTLLGISSFGEDASGELYVVDIGGTVYRIDPE